MSLKARITEDMKAAMRARETVRLGALRLLLAAIKQREIDERVELDDAGIVAVVDKQIKQRRDSIEQYQAANRLDLAGSERIELDVLSAYMPSNCRPKKSPGRCAPPSPKPGRPRRRIWARS
jgi:uncharacterized protein YqeY